MTVESLYIKIENGRPVGHPFQEWNMYTMFPDFTPASLPAGFEKFKRNLLPQIGDFEVFEGTTYEDVNGLWQDVHNVRLMTTEEKQTVVEKFAAENPKPFPSWTLSETRLNWVAPVPYPDDSKTYLWDEASLSWILFTEPE